MGDRAEQPPAQNALPEMNRSTLPLAGLCTLALALAACERKPPEPEPSATPTIGDAPVPAPSIAVPVASSSPTEAAPATTPVPSAGKLDTGALQERRDPARVLRFYAQALHARNWDAAARAWGKGTGITAAILKAAYDRPTPPSFEIGKGQGDAGAGSQFYEAPVVLRFGGEAMAERGTLTLRRVNDVDGATPDQLRWHIERSTIGVGQ